MSALVTQTLFACIAISLHGQGQPFFELNRIGENSNFVYEQRMVPPDLRKFFIPLGLAHYEGIRSPTQWCIRVGQLLHSLALPPSIRYVSPAYAPATYNEVALMAKKMDIETPLIFLASQKNRSVRTIQILLLGGGFYGLIFSEKFLSQYSDIECRALVAQELARISHKHIQKSHYARKIWQGITIAGTSLLILKTLYGLFKQHDRKVPEALRAMLSEYWPYMVMYIGAFGVTGIAAEILDAYNRKKYRKDADTSALKAFGATADTYMRALKNIEDGQAALQHERQLRYRDQYMYVLSKIDELEKIAHPYVACYLRGELGSHFVQLEERPALTRKAGPTEFSTIPSDD